MRIYLDHNAGGPLRPEAGKALQRWIARGGDGNPSSIHHAGQAARRELERAREQVAALIEAPPRTVTFTSGGTESNNLAIFGALEARLPRRRIVSSAIEHSSILVPLRKLARQGFEIVQIACDEDGAVDAAEAISALTPDTALVTLGLANSETGTIQEFGGVGAAARKAGALYHLDAAQAAGRIPLAVEDLDCDLVTLSGHKLGATAGSGALYVKPGLFFPGQMLGGPQEAGRRAGTPNLSGAITFGAVAERCRLSLSSEMDRLALLSNRLLDQLRGSIPGLRLNGPAGRRLPNTLNLTFPSVAGETLLIALDLAGVEVSMGSACAAGAVEPSHVLLAMGRSEAEARSSLRISLGWSTTAAEIEAAGAIIARVWRRIAAPQTEAH